MCRFFLPFLYFFLFPLNKRVNMSRALALRTHLSVTPTSRLNEPCAFFDRPVLRILRMVNSDLTQCELAPPRWVDANVAEYYQPQDKHGE